MQNIRKVLPLSPSGEVAELLPFRPHSRSSILNTASLIEPEDARITGVTRSLHRRLLALNLPQPVVVRMAPTSVTRQPQVRIA